MHSQPWWYIGSPSDPLTCWTCPSSSSSRHPSRHPSHGQPSPVFHPRRRRCCRRWIRRRWTPAPSNAAAPRRRRCRPRRRYRHPRHPPSPAAWAWIPVWGSVAIIDASSTKNKVRLNLFFCSLKLSFPCRS